jgi:hypothetical protein
MTIRAVLWRANEHFHEVVMQGVVELALEAPFELRIVEIAGMQIEIVDVYGHRLISKFDDDFDAVSFRACGEIQERMFVEAQLGEDSVET